MCGIAGFISKNNFIANRDALGRAALRLSHRGPDDSGFFFDEKAGIGLAHRRLSIIDLSRAGRQPMASDDNTIQVVFNGEIYNFRQIRDILTTRGHQFKSQTDTEVLLKAYLQWGLDCLTRFVGMFAIAIWDTNTQRLFLARDRLGIKPLYYYLHEGTFLFASELKALMAFKVFARDIDPEAVPLLLHYQYIPAPGSIFRNTFKLLPAQYLLYDGTNLNSGIYWKQPEEKEKDDFMESAGTEEDRLRELDRVITQAVSDRLISDVPLGALLSGGIDSTMVVAVMKKITPSPPRTFSIGFGEKGYNEAPWAERIARHLGTAHTTLYVTHQDALDVIARLPDIYDEPFADPSAIPTLLVSRMARSQVKVALSGDGGDELFCGYVRYWMTRTMALTFGRIPPALKSFLAGHLGRIPASWLGKCYSPFQDALPQRFKVANFQEKWQKLLYAMSRSQLQDLYRMTVCLWPEEELPALVGRTLPESHFEKAFRETRNLPVLSRLMQVDQKTYLPDAMLTKVDRASMAVGLEVRVPLLDHRVVEFASLLPEGLKYKNGTGKFLLKKLLARYVPPELFKRPKMGLGVPIDQWLRGDLKEILLDTLSPARIKNEGLFDPGMVQNKIDEHLSGRVNHQYRLWALLMWELWRDRWLG